MRNVYVYIAVMAIVTYLIRVLPLTLVRREIKNVYVRSFLYYVPYSPTDSALTTFAGRILPISTPRQVPAAQPGQASAIAP